MCLYIACVTLCVCVCTHTADKALVGQKFTMATMADSSVWVQHSGVYTHTHTHTHTKWMWIVQSSQDSRPTSQCEVLTAVWQWCVLTLHRKATGQTVLAHKLLLLKLNQHTATSWRHRGKNWAVLNEQWEGSLNTAPGRRPMDSSLTTGNKVPRWFHARFGSWQPRLLTYVNCMSEGARGSC